MPLYFREPSINLGVGEVKGQPPHLTDAAFRDYYKIAAKSSDAYALTADDFTGLAREYGRVGGMDRIATIVKQVRAERGADRTLLLDGGDTWQGSWSSLKPRGGDMVEVMSALGVDAMTAHWEFTYGTDRVKELVDKLPFAFLAQNVRDQEWQEKVFTSRKTFEKGGAKIAVIGQAFPRTPVSNPRWMIPKWEFGIRDEEMQKEVDDARAEGADVVVVLSHNGFDVDRKMAGIVKGIDIILTGHTHDAMPDVVKVGSTLLIGAGSHGKFIARLDIDAGGGKMKGYRFKLIPVFSDVIAPDPEMKALVDKIRAPYMPELSRVLGTTESLLYRRGNFNGTFDDLIVEAMLKERDAEIALSPGFRWGASLVPGDPITFEAVANATSLTYGNCYRMEMSGEQLKLSLEDIADNIFHPDPYFQGGGDMVRITVWQACPSRSHRGASVRSGRRPIRADRLRNDQILPWSSTNWMNDHVVGLEVALGPPDDRDVDALARHQGTAREPEAIEGDLIVEVAPENGGNAQRRQGFTLGPSGQGGPPRLLDDPGGQAVENRRLQWPHHQHWPQPHDVLQLHSVKGLDPVGYARGVQR